MNSFYNILKIARDPSSHDSISIGLVAFSNNRYFVQFSDRKIRIARNLLAESADIIDFFENQLKLWINDLNDSLKAAESTKLFPDKILDSDYFFYLNKYSNNLIQFSKPYFLNNDINSDDFRKLFILLISDDFQPLLKGTDLYPEFEKRIKDKLLDVVKEKVHTYAKLTEKVIPSLYFQFEMDCIGMNGAITGAKSIDFNRNESTIDKNLSHYFQISTLLAKIFNKDKIENNFFLIADEPSIINSKEHIIWEHLKKQKQFVLINSEESDLVAKKIEETKAHKFLDLEE